MHDTRRLSVQRLCQRGIDLIRMATGWTLFLPSLALAHGDDNVTAATFIGPMLALAVIVVVVSLGKALLRAIVKRS